MNINEQEILRMAMVGYAMELVKIQDQIDSVRVMLAIANSPIVRMAEKAKREKSRKGGRG